MNSSTPILVQAPPARSRNWTVRLLIAALIASLLFNVGLYVAYHEYYANVKEPRERYHAGDRVTMNKIAVVKITGTIMPPFTGRILEAIEKAEGDDNVKGILLAIDSPGGLVADSHQIYHKLRELNAKKPVWVSMKRMAASGGYYVAMGAGLEGKIYAEPTTWTGSIGVIIPRFDASALSAKIGITSDPLKTGEFKDALSPFKELTPAERDVWKAIMDDAFNRFLTVIAENRKQLDYAAIKELATGQIYTAEQAKANGMIDEIGFEDDALEALQAKLGLEKARVVTYEFRPTMAELLLGSVEAEQPAAQWQAMLDATVPRAMYFCSWGVGTPLTTFGEN